MNRNIHKIISELQWYMSSLISNWGDEDAEPNMIDVICDSRKWKPIKKDGFICVHYGDKCYEVRRTS